MALQKRDYKRALILWRDLDRRCPATLSSLLLPSTSRRKQRPRKRTRLTKVLNTMRRMTTTKTTMMRRRKKTRRKVRARRPTRKSAKLKKRGRLANWRSLAIPALGTNGPQTSTAMAGRFGEKMASITSGIMKRIVKRGLTASPTTDMIC